MSLGLPLVKLPVARKGLRVQQHALLWSARPSTPLSSASCRLPWCALFFLGSYLWSCYFSPRMHFLFSLPNNLQFAFNFRWQVLILVASVSFFPSPCAPAGFVLLPVPVQPEQHFCCSTSTSLFCDYFILTSPSPQSTSIPFSFSCESLAQATCSWLFVDFFLGQWFSIGGCLETFDHSASG